MAKHIAVTYTCDECGVKGGPNPDSHEEEPWPKGWVNLSFASNNGSARTSMICNGCLADVQAALKSRKHDEIPS